MEKMDPHLQTALKSIANRKFIFVGGKGGVGKSSSSCALALSIAKDCGKKVLLISTDPAHSVSDCLDQKLGHEAQLVKGTESLWALESDPSGGVDRLIGDAEATIGNSRSMDLVQEIRDMFSDMKDWLGNLPGIDEAVALMRILDADEGLDATYDCIILDTAPTGHTLKLLQLPGVLEKGIKKLEGWHARLAGYLELAMGFFRNSNNTNQANPSEQLARKLKDLKTSVEKLKAILTDAEKTTFICVGIAEALSVLESERLLESLRVANVASSFMIVNKLLTGKFLPSDETEAIKEESNQSTKRQKLDNGSHNPTDVKEEAFALCKSRAQIQSKYLSQLREKHSSTHTIICVQELPFEPRGVSLLEQFLVSWTVSG